ncbi:uncharacterized protein LOC123308255 [Coccinella septempunctata]|uniref:uncharacterized protein LOC123308255 n=1 Tax=Coccinella septempunctata TaxID=41139 RepID=UPI001D08221E|nr:uncharacterized protein LOC123308255 [Coccinella septempunctata]
MGDRVKQKVVEWLKDIFEKESVENLEFEFPDYDNSGGYAADIIFVDLSGIQNGIKKNYSVLVKKGKEVSQALDTLGLKRGYACEVELYSKTIPIFRELAEEKHCEPFKNIPECYGTVERDEEFIIILQNLKPKGFRVHDILRPHDLDHLKLVLEAYANWHAFNFALRDQKPAIFEKLGRNMRGIEKTELFRIYVNTLQKEIDFVVDFYKDRKKPHIAEKLKNLRKKVKNESRKCFVNEDEKYYIVRHGDCWNNNFLFRYNENERPDQVVVIDWQMGLLGSPLADVSQFILYCSSRKELEHLDELLKLYYDSLSRKLQELGSDPEKCFPWKACQEAFNRYAPLAVAGMTLSIRASFRKDTEPSYNITDSVETGDFCGILGEGVRDPEEYFDRIDGVLEFCVNKGYI